MIRDPDKLQRELDDAQADLQRHVGELKHLVARKLERPRHAIAIAKRPFAWLHVHAVVATLGALVIGAAIGLFARER